jgi:hypothetical protein
MRLFVKCFQIIQQLILCRNPIWVFLKPVGKNPQSERTSRLSSYLNTKHVFAGASRKKIQNKMRLKQPTHYCKIRTGRAILWRYEKQTSNLKFQVLNEVVVELI